MRELSVYYCPVCGSYAYYQIKQNAFCLKCNAKRKLLDVRYQDFMDLDLKQRDSLIAETISADRAREQRDGETATTPPTTITDRERVDELKRRIEELEHENQELQKTVEWMHATIWDLVKRGKASPH
ncbi:MAG: hypothetical protein LBR77_04370 [Lachnospiraceae bacterium]|nr:hypothetical protein [Lachnospiraceae bacterium]